MTDASAPDDVRFALLAEEMARVDGQRPGSGAALDKHTKMAANPFRFLRGAAQVFYRDLFDGRAQLPPALAERVPITTVMGDCHLGNFGFLTEEGSYGERVVFSPNDFDDACMGLAGWDLLRYCTSLFLAAEYGRGLCEGRYRSDELDSTEGLRAADDADAAHAARAFLHGYRKTCARSARDPGHRDRALDGFARKHVLYKPWRKARRRAAGGRDFLTRSALARAVDRSARPLRFANRAQRFRRLDEALHAEIEHAFRPHVDDEILDVVERLQAGTGSLQLSRYYLLVGPRELDSEHDLALCHVVEVKQQRPAAPLACFADVSPVNRLGAAHLTVDCQRIMQRRPDLVLDEVIWRDAHWLVRSRHHARVSLDPEDVVLARDRPGRPLARYAAACGAALALAHGRGDRRSQRFEKAMHTVLKRTAEELVDAARDYATRSIADQQLLAARLASAQAAIAP